MKLNFNIMRNLKRISLIIVTVVALYACNSEFDEIEDSVVIEQEQINNENDLKKKNSDGSQIGDIIE